jgi:hypothetical protein
MVKRMIFLAACLPILASLVFFLRVGALVPGEVNLDGKRMQYCFDVATDQEGKRLFVAAGYAGLHIFRLHQGHLNYVSTSYDGGYYRNLKIWNDRAYVADSERGLVVMDIRAEMPVTTWVQSSDGAGGVDVKEGKAYVAGYGRGLQVFDLSNPDSPSLLSTLKTPGCAWDVWANAGYAYIADMNEGLTIVDVSTPSSPRQVTVVTWTSRYQNAEIVRGEGGVVYVAAADHGLITIDVSNPANPVLASRYRPFRLGAAEGLAVRDGIVYLAMGSNLEWKVQGEAVWEIFTRENGLHIVDARDPYSLSLAGKCSFLGWVEGVHVAGSSAYVANAFNGVRSCDIRDPEHPVLADTFSVLP